MKKIEKFLYDIFTLFNSEDKKEIKNTIKKMILENFSNQLVDYCEGTYIFNPDTTDEIFKEALDEARNEVKQIITKRLMEKLIEKVNKL